MKLFTTKDTRAGRKNIPDGGDAPGTSKRFAAWITPKNIVFTLFNLAVVTLLYRDEVAMLARSLHNNVYSHILIIPFVSFYLYYTNDRGKKAPRVFSPAPGAVVIIVSLVLYTVGTVPGPERLIQNDYLSVMTLSLVVFFTGGYLLFYGTRALSAYLFVFLFLLFMVPVPTVILDMIIEFLRAGSAELSYRFLVWSGAPVLREGNVFHLPNISVEVAKECSGIRSSIAILITTAIAGHYFLCSWWRRVVFALAILPVVIFKNAVRIMVLTLLGNYVDDTFLTNSNLHRNGGVIFFLMGLVILGGVLMLLSWSERGAGAGRRNE